MKRRMKVNKKRSGRAFKSLANRTHKKNLLKNKPIMRGGIRL